MNDKIFNGKKDKDVVNPVVEVAPVAVADVEVSEPAVVETAVKGLSDSELLAAIRGALVSGGVVGEGRISIVASGKSSVEAMFQAPNKKPASLGIFSLV